MPWMVRLPRQIGYEVNADGYFVNMVVFYGEVPENVIIEPVPDGLENPRWDFENEKWVVG